MAKLCRKVCALTRLLIPVWRTALAMALLMGVFGQIGHMAALRDQDFQYRVIKQNCLIINGYVS